MKSFPLSVFFWAMASLFISIGFLSCRGAKETPVSTSAQDSPSPPAEPLDTSPNLKLAFWQKGQVGANGFNDPSPDNENAFSEEWFTAVADHKIPFIRLTTSKFLPSEGYQDFLIGSTEKYMGIPPADLDLLKQILDRAEAHHVKIWFVPLSLPGARWFQQNGGKRDSRLWQDPLWQKEILRFWSDLARELKDHPAIVAYSFLSEPAPEITPQMLPTAPAVPVTRANLETDLAVWYETAEGSLEDINRFYDKMIQAVREIDPKTPIILEAGLGANLRALPYLRVQNDPAILYSFHQYEPRLYTSSQARFKTDFRYPGKVPVSPKSKERKEWNKEAFRALFAPVEAWRIESGLEPWQIVVSEFGVNRQAKGADKYLADNISLFEEFGWTWAFYSFRENWDGMDYELGSKPLPWKYWEAVEKGESFELVRTQDNPLYRPIRDALEKRAGVKKSSLFFSRFFPVLTQYFYDTVM